MARILVVDDEQRMVVLLTSALRHRGHEVVGASGGGEALALAGREPFDLVLTDLRMEPVDGMAVISGVKQTSPGTQVVVLTAYGEVATAVEALRRGAYQYLTKPFNFDEVIHVVDQALAEADLARQNRALRRASAGSAVGLRLVGQAPATECLRELIAKVAPTEATVLIRGESGTGKELVARAVHAAGLRSDGPFIAVNCAALAESLLESELFGHRQGAFTGADRHREGLFEAAEGGTLFLDEIGEAGGAVQAKLLRVLDERRFNRVGDPHERVVDVRIIAATNRPLEQAIQQGRFREDLYYRLAVFPLDVPPLRERVDDIEALAGHFLAPVRSRGDLAAGPRAAATARLPVAGQRAGTAQRHGKGTHPRRKQPRGRRARAAGGAHGRQDGARWRGGRPQPGQPRAPPHPRRRGARQRQQEPGGAPAGHHPAHALLPHQAPRSRRRNWASASRKMADGDRGGPVPDRAGIRATEPSRTPPPEHPETEPLAVVRASPWLTMTWVVSRRGWRPGHPGTSFAVFAVTTGSDGPPAREITMNVALPLDPLYGRGRPTGVARGRASRRFCSSHHPCGRSRATASRSASTSSGPTSCSDRARGDRPRLAERAGPASVSTRP